MDVGDPLIYFDGTTHRDAVVIHRYARNGNCIVAVKGSTFRVKVDKTLRILTQLNHPINLPKPMVYAADDERAAEAKEKRQKQKLIGCIRSSLNDLTLDQLERINKITYEAPPR